MHLLQDLRKEHELIDSVTGSLRSFALRLAAGDADPVDGERFITFFRVFAGQFHHAREEEILFRALVEAAELPRERGPIANLLGDHATLARTLVEMAVLLGRPRSPENAKALVECVASYCRGLWLHIDAENSVLFRESEDRLRRAGVLVLPARQMNWQERSAARFGEALLAAYPPSEAPDVIRGEQCVICPHFGGGCEGIEREWWGESEWQEFPDHVG